MPSPATEIVGYARVSTGGQELALQLDALNNAGAERIYQDVGSGSLRSRPAAGGALSGQ